MGHDESALARLVDELVERRVAERAGPDPGLMACFEPYAGNGFAVKYGERLRKDDPRYIEGRFLPADTPDHELRAAYVRTIQRGTEEGEERARQTLAEMAKEHEKAPPPKDPREAPLRLQRVAIKHVGPFGGTAPMARFDESREPRVIDTGQIADARWGIVKRNKRAFVPVLPDGVDADDALVCVAPWPGVIQMGADGLVARQIYPMQLASPMDPLVQVNPTMFVLPGVDGAPLPQGDTPFALTVVASPQQVVADSGRPTGSGYMAG
jgi:hypothetical protein